MFFPLNCQNQSTKYCPLNENTKKIYSRHEVKNGALKNARL